jgi:electron transport complex protein RnfG
MAKKESTFTNMVIALLVVTGIAATTLGYVYEFTKEPIALAKLNKKLNAIKEVVPEFTNNPDAEKYSIPTDGDSIMVYPAKVDNKIVGVAIETYTMKGFSGLIKLMVGLAPDGSVRNVSVLEHKETPGLGTHMADVDFINQFVGKDPVKDNIKVSKDGGSIDAITAATISSRAFSDAVQRAADAYNNLPKAAQLPAIVNTNTENEGGHDESAN